MAKKSTGLAVCPTKKEQVWGILYLLFSLFVLPYLLSLFNSLLHTPLNNAWFNFLYFSLNFLCVFWIFHGFFKRSLIHAGSHFWDFILSVVAGAAMYWVCSWALSILFTHAFPDFENLNDSTITQMAHGNFAIMLVGTVFFVPIAEESLYRGLVFGSIYPKSHWAAYFISMVVFSAIHTINYIGVYSLPNLILAFAQYLPAGLILAWAYRKSGSIFAPIVIHAAINAIGLFSIFFSIG